MVINDDGKMYIIANTILKKDYLLQVEDKNARKGCEKSMGKSWSNI
ncbi:predicted protein [Botrytis cinerea T4]|uniref:Uncharacterized protein n=1 Tax=Botryotinia fuckeliana (strain T4) TaxID=999810 RepID=G2Y7J7_BOTF4|nr:predicted protein [Botrytis cinerea T4]